MDKLVLIRFRALATHMGQKHWHRPEHFSKTLRLIR